MNPSSSMLVRRAEALQLTGLTDEQFSKAVNAETIAPVYLVWQVRDARDAIVCEASAEAARAEAARIGGRAEPVGRAYYRRADLLRLNQPAETTAHRL
jgi:hypothetical protein